MTGLERFILWATFVLVILVGGFGYWKLTQIRAWGNEVAAWTKHVQDVHSAPIDPPGGNHNPPPPPPPKF